VLTVYDVVCHRSCYRCKFDDSGLEWSLDMSDLVLQYTLYLKIMQHFRTVLPGRVVDIRYAPLLLCYKSGQHSCLMNGQHS
jgi:hypothetical protein